MKFSRNLTVIALVFVVIGFIVGYTFSDFRKPANYRSEIRKEFLHRHQYQVDALRNLRNDISPLLTNFAEYSTKRSRVLPNDSIEYLLGESSLMLQKCEQALYELAEFKKADSSLFEMYGN